MSKTIPDHIIKLIQSITYDELVFISCLDYGEESYRHLNALKHVIFENNCMLSRELDQSWFPYEVIELGSNSLQEGHEREFTICTLLILYGIITGYDLCTDANYKFESRASDYDKLPKEFFDLIMSAYPKAIKISSE